MINLLPITEKQRIRRIYHLRVSSVCLISLFFILLIAILSFLPNFFLADSKYQKILAETQTKESIVKQSQELEMRKAVNETNAKIILLKSTSTPSVSSLFREILESRPAGVYITSFSYDTNSGTAKKESAYPYSIVVQGTAGNRANLLSFVSALNKEKRFSAIDLPISNLISDINVSYTLNISGAPFRSK